MTKIKTLKDLERLREEGEKLLHPSGTRITIGMATCCIACGSDKVRDAINEEIKKRDLRVEVVPTGCMGICYQEPTLEVFQPEKPKITYGSITVEKVPELIATIVEGKVKSEWALYRTDNEEFLLDKSIKPLSVRSIPEEYQGIPEYSEIPFFQKQRRIVLRNSGKINPECIQEYIATGGYFSLYKALQMKPEELIEEIASSGLRGRSGGGFPTGAKWLACRQAKGEKKYVICNASEGDPGIGMHKSLLESDPHSILEGLIIGAYAIGADEGYIYISSGYPLGLKRMKKAVEDAYKYGILGENIMNLGFNFKVTLKEGGGAYVCGESTALMASIEEKIGEPRPKYIHTAEKGLFQAPTDLNNLETWANVPVIIGKGSKWYSKIGTEKSKGTKVISLTGSIQNPCLIEVPLGISLYEILEMGNGLIKGRKLKAIQIGGPAGGVLPAELINLPLEFDQLSKIGSNLGSGGIVVMDEKACMVEVTKYFLTFLKEESCGKCIPCREGLKKLLELVERITIGIGTKEDLSLMEELSWAMEEGSLCELGKTAPHIFLSTLQYFQSEYEAHLEGKCPAGVCKDLTFYSIESSICTKCSACISVCPTNAISSEPGKTPTIDLKKCNKCGACMEVCEVEAIKA